MIDCFQVFSSHKLLLFVQTQLSSKSRKVDHLAAVLFREVSFPFPPLFSGGGDQFWMPSKLQIWSQTCCLRHCLGTKKRWEEGQEKVLEKAR